MLKEQKRDPKPTSMAEVYVVMFVGRIARYVANWFSLEQAPSGEVVLGEYHASMRQHQAAREALGHHPQIPEHRYIFDEQYGSRGEGTGQKGVPNANVGVLLAGLKAAGCFLIAARYYVDELDRDVARFTFSRKESDRPLELHAPSMKMILRYFEDRVYEHVHIWDKRYVDVTQAEYVQLGNNTISVCGCEQTADVCGTRRILYLGNSGETKDPSGLYSFDTRKWQVKVVAASPKPTLEPKPRPRLVPPARKAVPNPLMAPLGSYMVMDRDGPEFVRRASRGKR